MSAWDYRIVKREDGTFGLHEVYYDKKDSPYLMKAEPVDIVWDSPGDIVAMLKQMLKDVENRPTLEYKKGKFKELPKGDKE